jgi:hypothetical protein
MECMNHFADEYGFCGTCHKYYLELYPISLQTLQVQFIEFDKKFKQTIFELKELLRANHKV